MPFFAALAEVNPEAGRDLAQIAGAPLDTDAADPTVRAALAGPGGGLAGILAAGRAAFVSLRESFSRPPRGMAAPRPPPKRRKRKNGKS